MNQAERTPLEEELRRRVKGEVLFDEMSRLIYSTDASLYQIKPLGVILPRSAEEILQTIQIAAHHGVPVLPRGAGTSLAGQTVLAGLVVDCSKYLNRIIEINRTERWVRVQPGIVLDNLNEVLKPYHLHFAPDVATSSRANIGGMIGNNSAGVRSIRYGKTVDNVLELISPSLYRGTTVTEKPERSGAAREMCSGQSRGVNLFDSAPDSRGEC